VDVVGFVASVICYYVSVFLQIVIVLRSLQSSFKRKSRGEMSGAISMSYECVYKGLFDACYFKFWRVVFI
jgi:hypothetical protein